MTEEMMEFHAFPEGWQNEEGLSILEYFAARAPSEPQPWFQPEMPPRPKCEVTDEPVPNDGGDITDQEIREAQSWRKDPCWDLENPKLSYWLDGIRKHWEEKERWEAERRVAMYSQWPWAWAKAVLRAKP